VEDDPLIPAKDISNADKEYTEIRNICDEIVQTERMYVSKLDILVTYWLQPLEEYCHANANANAPIHKKKGAIPKGNHQRGGSNFKRTPSVEDLQAIFANCRDLLTVNRKLLDDLNSAEAKTQDDGGSVQSIQQSATAICNAFLTYHHFFVLYAAYCSNYKQSPNPVGMKEGRKEGWNERTNKRRKEGRKR
jgi:hypothetical protein